MKSQLYQGNKIDFRGRILEVQRKRLSDLNSLLEESLLKNSIVKSSRQNRGLVDHILFKRQERQARIQKYLLSSPIGPNSSQKISEESNSNKLRKNFPCNQSKGSEQIMKSLLLKNVLKVNRLRAQDRNVKRSTDQSTTDKTLLTSSMSGSNP